MGRWLEMRANTYRKKIMVDDGNKAKKWIAASHECSDLDLKASTLTMGMMYGTHFIESANEYLDALIHEEA
jgi:hypothetical protein